MLERRNSWLVGIVMLVACGGESTNPAGPHAFALPAAPSPTLGEVIPIQDEDDLYREVNDPANAGATLQLAAGTYKLDPTQEKEGRLELQHDMSLTGQAGNKSAVIIDASALTNYLLVDGVTTGAIRVGRGANSISWLTVEKAVLGAAAIETDLPSSIPPRVTISNVIARGNRRGIDVRNVGSTAAGRVLVVTITDSELYENTMQMGQGLRIVNESATGAVIRVTLARNIARNNRFGCFAGNNAVQFATIMVQSDGDQFDSNGIGCGVVGGVSVGAVASTNNVVSFTARGSTFRNNTGMNLPATAPPPAGFTVEGGSTGTTGSASFNTASVVLLNPVFANNYEFSARAWGARSMGTVPAGTNNVASVVISGAPGATVNSVPSLPGPAGTNVVSVVKY